MRTLQQILVDVNSYVDLDASVPTGVELTVRTNYVNQAIQEWASSYSWDQLNETINVVATNSTISIPSNFRESVQGPKRYIEPDTWEDFTLIKESEQYTPDVKTAYIKGNAVNGYVMTFRNMPEMSSVSFIYQRFPSGMVTLTDRCEVPDPDFVKTKVISYVLQSRSDERFPIVEAEAKRLLTNMIGRSMKPYNGGYRSVPRSERYRIG